MSLLGKIFAFLNILGAIAFVVVAFMDFAKRESWAYANFVHDVAYKGLPLDDKETDDRETPLKNELADSTKKDWFGADPVSTQVEEVDRVHKAVDAQIASAANGDPLKETAELARLLTPFATHYDEREWNNCVRTYLATPDAEAKLHQRLHDAFVPAVQACVAAKGGLKFPQAFVDACRDEGGDPAPAFEMTFLRLLPAKPDEADKAFADGVAAAIAVAANPANPALEAHDRAEKFLQVVRGDAAAKLRKPAGDPAAQDALDDVYQTTLTTVHDDLKARLDALFDEARNGPVSAATPPPAPPTRLRDAQRAAIARLLFNLMDVTGGEPGAVNTPAYSRFASVVGLKAAVQEVNDEAALLRTFLAELSRARDLERNTFAIRYTKGIDQLRDRAALLHAVTNTDTPEGGLLEQTLKRRDAEAVIVGDRQKDVDAAEKDLADARAATAKDMEDLRKASDSLLDLRLRGRDVLGENLRLEKQIRDLENKH